MWQSLDTVPRHTWVYVTWRNPRTGERVVALGAFDGGFWRADGYVMTSVRNDWEPVSWALIDYPEDSQGAA
jgi:hypothetical protein